MCNRQFRSHLAENRQITQHLLKNKSILQIVNKDKKQCIIDRRFLMAKSDQRTRLTKLLIRRAFTDLVKQKPIQSISIKELCEIAGINRGTFYSHYTDIYDLLEKIEAEMLQDFQASLAPLLENDDNELTSLKITAGVFSCLKENADICAMTLGPYGDKEFALRLLRIGREKCMESYIKYFIGASPKKIEYYYAFVSTGCMGLLERWLADGMTDSAEDIAEAAEAIMMNGIAYLNS